MIPQKYLDEMEKYEKEPDYYGVITIQLHRKGRKVRPRYVFNYEESTIEEADPNNRAVKSD
jgi:hypothetical protein